MSEEIVVNPETVAEAPVRIITLTYTEDELNKIINMIAQLPYASCFALIHNIQAQAQAQLPKE